MSKVKWIFLAYMGLVALILAGIGLSFAVVPPRDPNTLYLTHLAQVTTMDPPRISDVPAAEIAGYMFETLYNYDYYNETLVPELATAPPEISPDGKTVTIHVKPDIRFFDPHGGIKHWEPVTNGNGKVIGRRGPELTAADFVYSWKRLCNFHVDSQAYKAIFEGKVLDIEAFREQTRKAPKDRVDYAWPVDGLEARGQTIVIKLVDRFSQLGYCLAQLTTAPVSRDAVETYGDGIKFKPVATGPYYLADHRPDERIVFQANPIYRGAPGAPPRDPAERLPYIKRVRIDYFQEALPAWALFQQSLIDVAPIPPDAFAIAIDPLSRDLRDAQKQKGIKLVTSEDPAVSFFGFNMNEPPFKDNKPLRRAMSLAHDRAEYINLMLNGRGHPAVGLIPPGFATHDEDAVNPNAWFDLNASRKQLNEAEGIHGGPIPEITLLMGSTSTAARQQGELVQAQMARIGLKIRVECVPWARFLEMVEGRQAKFFSLRWQPDYPDEQTFFQLFYSKHAPEPNYMYYANPAYDTRYEQAAALAPDTEERNMLYWEMAAIIEDDCPVILSHTRTDYRLHYDWVSNIIRNPYRHGNRAYHKLDVERRRRYLSRN